MPVGAFVPSKIHLDYPEWQTPVIGDVGKVWAYTGSGYAPASFLLSAAVSAFGLTLIDDADAATARTTLGLGTAAVLNAGTGANNIVQLTAAAKLPAVDGSSLTNLPAGSAAGSTTQVQYNASGVFAGDAGMTYNAAADALTVAGYVVTPAIRVPVNSITPFQVRDAAGTAVFTVDTTNGRVGIGNTAPGNTLDVSGSIKYSTALIGPVIRPAVDINNLVKIQNGAGSINIFSVDTSSFVATLAGTTNARLTIDSVYSQGAGDTGVALGIYDNTTKYFSFHPNYADGRSTIVMGSPSRAGAFDFYNYRSLGGKGSWDITINTHNGSAVSTERMRITGNSAVADLLISNAKLGIGNTPTALLDIAASTTASASLRVRAGTAPTSPNAGDIYFNGINFFGYNGSAWKQLDN